MGVVLFSQPRVSSTPSQAESVAARYGVRITAAIGMAIGGFWLVAWFVGWGAQWSSSRFINPKTNLALGVFLAGSALLLLRPKSRSRPRRSAGAVLAVFVLLIGALTLSEHLLHYNFGIDQLLAKEAPGAAATTSPNRMGPPAATSLTLLGVGLLLLSRKRGRIAPYLGLSVVLISLVPAVGYLYGIDAFFGRAQVTGIAWPTVMALLSLGAALVLAHPESEPMTLLLRNDAGGVLLRRLMPAVLLIPLVLGFIVMQARQRALVDRATGTGLLVIALAAIFSILLWRNAAHLSRAETELSKLASFPMLNPYPITELDLAGHVHFVNPAARALFPDMEQRGTEHPWCADWDSLVNTAGKDQKGVQTRDISVGERHYLQTISYVPGAERIRIYGLDITARQQAEEARRASEERFRVAQELSPDGFSILRPVRDSQGRVADFIWVYANATIARITGIEPEALVGRSLLELFPGHRGSPLLQGYQQAAETGEAQVCEALYEGDGILSDRWFRVAVVSMGNDIAVLSQDISERKRAEEALREASEHRQLALDAAELGTWDYRFDRGEVFWDERCRLLFGIRIGEKIEYDGALACIHPDDRAGVHEAVTGAIAGADGGIYHRVFRVVWPDGSVHWVDSHGRVHFASEGDHRKAVRFIGVNADITEVKRTQEVLIRSEKVAALGRMAAGLAHDINNPLDAVMNTLFLARSNAKCAECTDSVRPYLELADEELKRVSHISQQALGFYRDETTPTQGAIRTILDETVDMFRSKIKSKNARVEKQYECDIVEVIAIRGELRQILANLFANSLDAIAQGGTIKLRVKSLPDMRVRITIADNGKGIESCAMPRIFEPLFTTKGSLGTGLGLWVTKQLVDKYGGSIRVRSSVNGGHRGTTFTVVLPGAAAACEQAVSA